LQYVIRPLGTWTDPVTDKRHGSHLFRVTWDRTLRDLDYELRYLDATNVVFQIDVTEGDIRLDGMLRSNAKVGFPGVKIAFDSKFGPLTYATDAYEQQYGYSKHNGWQANIRAVALGLEALRAVDRYGITRRGEQYVGWKALPSGLAVGQDSHMTRDTAISVIVYEALEPVAGWRDITDDTIGPEATHRLKLVEAWKARQVGADDRKALVKKARANAHPDRNHSERGRWNAVESALIVLRNSGDLDA
jgi:hypothetical protein